MSDQCNVTKDEQQQPQSCSVPKEENKSCGCGG